MSLLKLKKSSVSGKVPQPADLQFGELALNYADGIIFYKNANNSIASISGGSSQPPVSGSGGIIYISKSTNYTAQDKDGILADTSAGSFTVTLPADPTIGTQVFIADKANWGINNLVIAGNGATIEGVVQNKIVDVGNISIHLVYNGNTWQLFAQPGIVSTLVEAGSVSDVFTRHSFIATDNQTVFPLVYTPGQVEAYVNGVLISTGDYTATNGTSVVFNSGIAQNSVVEIKKYSDISLFTRESITSTAGQTVITTNYIPSLLEVYINGVLANNVDYTATNGTTIVFSQALPANIVIDIKKYAGGSTFSRNVFTATAGQTTFPILYIKGLVEVYLNGVLANPKDYTAADGTSIVFNSPLTAGTLVYIKKFSLIPYGALDWNDLINKPTLGTAAATDASAYATAAQGTKADTAVQPGSLATIATTGNYTDLTNKPTLFSGSYTDLTDKPTLGTAASTNSTAYATAAQGTKADTAVQPGSLATIATTGSYTDLLNKPSIPSITGLATEIYVDTRITDLINGAPTALDTLKEISDQLAADESAVTALVNVVATKANTSSLAAVATTGSYSDLLNKPTLFSGSYLDLTNKPTIFSGVYADLTGKPILFSGNYADLDNKPLLFSGSYTDLTSKPTLFSGSYTDLTDKPTLGTAAATDSSAYATAAQGTKADTAVQPGSLATIATTGSYTDLLNKPSIPSITGLATETYVDTRITSIINGAPAALDTLKEIADQLASDESAVAAITTTLATKANTSSLAVVATTGSYTDLTNKPTLGTAAATNVTAYATALQGSKADTAVQPGSLAAVATSGNYNDLINKPTSTGGITYIVKTAEYVAKDNEGILADTSTGGFSILMPASPAIGAQVFIADKGNWAVNPITIAGNGSTVDGNNTSRTVNIGDVSIHCIYDGTTWKLFTLPNIVDTSSGTISDIFVRNTFKSYSPQTTIKTIYTPGQLEVYINGILIPRSEYTATNGTSITFTTAIPAEAVVDVKKYSNFSLFTRTTIVVGYNNATVFNNIPYIPALLEVFVNGVMVNAGDYTATNGTQVIFNTGVPINTVVEFKAYAGGSTFSNNIFTATANQTVFPVQHVKELTEVYLNGVLANPEDYWSYSNTIEFLAPLPAGTLVYIKKFSKIPYGDLDWANITNKPTSFGVTSYNDLTNKPTLFSGSYADLTNKPTIPSITGLASEAYVNSQIGNLINNAPATLDTLKEIADQLADDESAVASLVTVVATKASTSSLAAVATSGSYTDLLNKPTLFSGSYTDLTNKPTIFSGAYADLTGKPTLSTVATSGSYNDLTDKPAGGTTYIRKTANYTASDRDGIIADTSAGTFTVSLPASPTLGMQITIVDGDNWGTNNLIVGRNGSTIETASTDLTLDIPGVSVQFIYDGTTWEVFAQAGALSGVANPVTTFVRTSYVATALQTTFAATYAVGLLEVYVNGLLLPTTDYTATNGISVILNDGLEAGSLVDIKSYSSAATSLLQTDWSTVTNKPTLFSGNYTDLTNKPTIFSGDYTDLLNKPVLFSGSYADLTNKPTLFSGSYTDLTNKPTINGPAFSAYAASISQTIPNNAQTKVLFQTEEFDTNSCYSNSKFTPNVAGYYQLNAEVRLDGATGTGETMIILYKNGSEYKRGTNQQGTQTAANFWALQVSSLAYANGSTDYFEIYVQQGSGGSINVTAVNNSAITWFNGCMLRGA